MSIVHRTIAALLFGAAACASRPAIEPRRADPVEVSSTQQCSEKSVTVVKMEDGKDIDTAATQVAQALRDAGYAVTFEEPADVVGTWVGTSVVGSSGACRSICANTIAGVIRHVGFRPALNGSIESTTSDGIACTYSVYIGIDPRTEGQFILY